MNKIEERDEYKKTQEEQKMASVPVPETQQSPSEQNDSRSSWFSFIMKDVKAAKNNQSQGPKIPKVPNELLNNETKECYSPLVVSIGPYHYSNRNGKFNEVESLKIPMTREFVLDSGKPIQLLYSKIEEAAPTARGFYAEGSTDGFSDEQFTRMMFIDGCFILQFIHFVTGNCDNLEMSDQQVAYVKQDLLLVENQLPFPVLESLMRLRYEEKHDQIKDYGMKIIYDFLFLQIYQPGHHPLPVWARRLLFPWFLLLFLSCALNLFFLQFLSAGLGIILLGGVILFGVILSLLLRSAFVRKKKRRTAQSYGDQKPLDDRQPAHLLELLYSIMLGSQNRKTKLSNAPTRSRDHCLYYSAKDLKKVGIHFSPSKTGALSDVKFRSSILYGTLYLPPITIDESTRAKLLNLVAYETSAALEKHWVTSYVCFLDALIEDAADVEELRSKGILFNYLGPDQQVADLINNMGRFVKPKNISVYNDVERDINKQCEGILSKWVAEWQNTYFSSPWAFTAFAAAGVGLALTAAQTYYTIHPPKL